MNLTQAEPGRQYFVQAVHTDDEEMSEFLFRLGCYSGEPITVVSKMHSGYVVSIKEGRYNMDKSLAGAIMIQ